MLSMVHTLKNEKKETQFPYKSIKIYLHGHVAISHRCVSTSFPIHFSLEIFSLLFFADKHSRFRNR
jgi:hypothetical protein